MNPRLSILLIPAFGLLAACAPAMNWAVYTSDPDQARLITSDITNFWNAYDQGKSGDLRQSLESLYLGKASNGLRDWVRLRIKSSEQFAQTVQAKRGYYESTRASTSRIAELEPQIRRSFAKLKQLYPEAVFPDVYFVIGRMNSGGTFGPSGLLIGAELYGRTPHSPTAELDDWEKAVTQPAEQLPYLVAHELIHAQQRFRLLIPTLLAQSVKEGSADFIAELIAGGHANPALHRYGDANEKALWLEFKTAMHGTDLSNWLYQGSKSTTRPADLGYYIGYKIVEAYYRRATDKQRAIREILHIQDFDAFLRASGYAARFE